MKISIGRKHQKKKEKKLEKCDQESKVMAFLAKAIATAVAGAVCAYWMWWTKGESGIGWFLLSLWAIW